MGFVARLQNSKVRERWFCRLGGARLRARCCDATVWRHGLRNHLLGSNFTFKVSMMFNLFKEKILFGLLLST